LGSLGFLTNFDFADHQPVMDSALDSGIRVNLRMRFTCTVYRAIVNEKGKGRQAVKKGQTGEIMMKNVEQGGWEALEGGWSGGPLPEGTKTTTKDKAIMCFSTRAVETFEVLNDLVVDRGPSPYVSQLELFGVHFLPCLIASQVDPSCRRRAPHDNCSGGRTYCLDTDWVDCVLRTFCRCLY
jgi:NAD+ kinase